MRTLRFLLQKEFRQVFRDKNLLRQILMVPIIQLLIFPWAANDEVKSISLAIVDHDHSSYSEKFISKIFSSGYFIHSDYTSSFKDAYQLIERDKADIAIEIPQGFEKNLVRENQQKIFLAVNAINGVKAIVGTGYLASIITDYNSQIRAEWVQADRFNAAPAIEITSSNWFNPLLNYKMFMVPGILAFLISTYSDTQQQAMSISFFFIMVFNLLSGLYTPIESMPAWAKVITDFNPLRYFIEVMRMVVLKGSSFHDVSHHFLVIFLMAVVLNTWAILNYRKTT